MKFLIRKTVHYLGNVFRFFQILFLKASGAKIGKNTMISLGAKIDVRRGKVIIGDHCLITHGCYILSHDGAAHVISPEDNGSGYVTVGDHVIIGAGSVVNKDIPDGAVAAGNPIKIIKYLERPYIHLPKIHRDIR